jgi:hypothetical protein
MRAGLLVFVSNLMRQGGSPGYTPIPLHICPTQPPPPGPPNPALSAAIEEFYQEPSVERIQKQVMDVQDFAKMMEGFVARGVFVMTAKLMCRPQISSRRLRRRNARRPRRKRLNKSGKNAVSVR